MPTRQATAIAALAVISRGENESAKFVGIEIFGTWCRSRVAFPLKIRHAGGTEASSASTFSRDPSEQSDRHLCAFAPARSFRGRAGGSPAFVGAGAERASAGVEH